MIRQTHDYFEEIFNSLTNRTSSLYQDLYAVRTKLILRYLTDQHDNEISLEDTKFLLDEFYTTPVFRTYVKTEHAFTKVVDTKLDKQPTLTGLNNLYYLRNTPADKPSVYEVRVASIDKNIVGLNLYTVKDDLHIIYNIEVRIV